ncbi:hypothetical protein SGRA_0366 [Saprospira grandis str. Lewin]|uniref:Uncharacterized protein n=1 Tax=Saprospira grandis (strain Lewin) TaxID=984262 RepID=H6L8W9_SAPGL|nr:hypothetical protein SGRA_0366 [Saprospira grandis str. Lewin]
MVQIKEKPAGLKASGLCCLAGGEAPRARRANGPALRRGGRRPDRGAKRRRAEQACEPRSIAAAAPIIRAAAGPKTATFVSI